MIFQIEKDINEVLNTYKRRRLFTVSQIFSSLKEINQDHISPRKLDDYLHLRGDLEKFIMYRHEDGSEDVLRCDSKLSQIGTYHYQLQVNGVKLDPKNVFECYAKK